RLTVVTDALTKKTTTTYDGNGNTETVKDALSRVTTYVNDPLGRVKNTINALGGTATYTYDGAGLPLVAIDEGGKKSETVYDYFKRGLVAQEIDAEGTQEQISALTSYDDDGEDTLQRDARGAWTDLDNDALDRVTETIDALGNKTQTVYDKGDQVVQSV